MNKLETGKTYPLAAINGQYPRHSIVVIKIADSGTDFICDVIYVAGEETGNTGCRFSASGVSRNLGEDCRVDWDKVNFPEPPVPVPGPCVAHAFCDEQMQTTAVDTDMMPVIGTKADGGKPKPRLLHESMAEAVASVVDVLTFGAAKYSDDNWKNVEPKRYTDALYRHLNAHHKGEANDAESGLPHLAHAACCVLFLLHHEVNK